MADRVIEHTAPTRAEERPPTLALPGISVTSAQRTAIALLATIAVTFAVQAPVLAHYFFNDDFVPLADIATRSTGGYIKDLFLLRDLTPNWRFLTGLVYLVEYRAFHLHAMPYFLVNVLFHTATSGLIFWLVRRASKSDLAAMFSAGLFGVAAATVPTVGQITALNNVLAGFFVTLAIVLLFEALDRTPISLPLFLGAVAAYTAAIASNESTAVVAPVLALLVLWKAPLGDNWWQKTGEWSRIALYAVPFAVLGGSAAIGFGTCGCTEAELYSRDNIIDNLWMYLGRLMYPIGLEFPGHTSTAHIVAGTFVIILALLALVRGPALARIAAVFLFLAVVPYLPIDIWSAQRYTYLASVPFAILGGLLFLEAARFAGKLSPAFVPAIAGLAAAAIALNAWQTLSQNADQADASDRWRQLVTTVDEALPDVPAKSTVYVRGGPVTDELAQCAVMPAIGEMLWGDVKLFTFAPEKLSNYAVRPGYSVIVGDFAGGTIVTHMPPPANTDPNAPGFLLLPHVPPEATGNVCRLDIPTFP